MKPNWNERYSEQEFAYGKEPNEFFKEWLSKFEPGEILMPADGEGRNGVYAARLGWQVTSFDLSTKGRDKAMQLAKEHKVTIRYEVGDFGQLDFEESSFDAIGLIYAHFSGETKADYHKKLSKILRPGGLVIFEAFSKNHLAYREQNPRVGGPGNIDVLFSKEEILADFKEFKIIRLEEEEIQLNEGKFHIGTGSVIRFVGKKPIC